jgi:hypothetical protein
VKPATDYVPLCLWAVADGRRVCLVYASTEKAALALARLKLGDVALQASTVQTPWVVTVA